MGRRFAGARAACAVLSLATASFATETLPLSKVRLYETGVAYFEREGTIASGAIGLPVPTRHLDDALKTLVVLDTSGQSQISGIEFDSSVSRSLGRALAGLPSDAEVPLGFLQLIASLRGAPVEVKVGHEVVRGRLVEVLPKDASGLERCVGAGPGADSTACVLQQFASLVMTTDQGEIRRFSEDQVTSVRPLEAAQRTRLGAALDAVSRGSARATRELSVVASGGRAVRLGYVTEAPVWRSTYRLVLADDGKPARLQGWALLHNDTEEDWRHVALELVNGRPDSYLYPLAAPRYAERPLVTPPEDLYTVPQLFDQTVDERWATGAVGMLWSDEIGDSIGFGGLGLSGTGEGGGGRGEGIGLGSIGTLGHGAGAAESESPLVTVGSLASLAPAAGEEAGAVFRYTIARPIDLGAHSSVLVPFADESVEVRRIAWFANPGAAARSALHLVNSTTQTLPAGTVAVFADGGFAGDSAIERLKPREERIICYGTDLDVELTEESRTAVDQPRLLRAAGAAIDVHGVRAHDVSYRIENRSGAPRAVYIELHYSDNSVVSGADRLTYDVERQAALAVFDVPAHETVTRHLSVQESRVDSHAPDAVTGPWLARLSKTGTLPAAQRAVLAESAQLAADAEKAAERRFAVEEDLAAELRDSERLRALVDALPRGGRKGKKLVKRLEEGEREIERLQAESAKLAKEKVTLVGRSIALLERLNATEAPPRGP